MARNVAKGGLTRLILAQWRKTKMSEDFDDGFEDEGSDPDSDD